MRSLHARHTLLAAGIGLLVAGCGSGTPSNSASNGSGSGPSFGSLTADAYKQSACMRSHGVPNFPDPRVITGNGRQIISLGLPGGVAQSPAFKAAQKSCAGIMPKPQPNAVQGAAQQQVHKHAVLVFAQCLRGHGISEFPDPTAQGQLTLEMVRAAGVDLHSPQVLAAAKVCVGLTHGVITGADVERAINSSP